MSVTHSRANRQLDPKDARRLRGACVRGTRITVWGLVNSRRLGLADEQILRSIHGLTSDDLRAAWEYYVENKAEIDEDIRVNEAE